MNRLGFRCAGTLCPPPTSRIHCGTQNCLRGPLLFSLPCLRSLGWWGAGRADQDQKIHLQNCPHGQAGASFVHTGSVDGRGGGTWGRSGCKRRCLLFARGRQCFKVIHAFNTRSPNVSAYQALSRQREKICFLSSSSKRKKEGQLMWHFQNARHC